MSVPREPVDLIRAKVNKFGELHLDKEQTEILLRWLEACQRMEEQLNENIAAMKYLNNSILELGRTKERGE